MIISLELEGSRAMNLKPKKIITTLATILCVVLLNSPLPSHPHDLNDPELKFQRPFKSPHFNTPYKTETEFIMTQMVVELARMVVFIRSGTVPLPDKFNIHVEEWANKHDIFNYETLFYLITAQVNDQQIFVNDPYSLPNHSIWDPATLIQLLETSEMLPSPEELSQRMSEEKLKYYSIPDLEPLPDFLERHSELNPFAMIEDSKELSARLTILNSDPQYHCRAAILLGLFSFREDAGNFDNQREYLSRMTCHLALADYLGNSEFEDSMDRQFAELLYDCIANRQVEVLNNITEFQNNLEPKDLNRVLPWLKVFRLRANGRDYRVLNKSQLNSTLEKIEYIRAISRSMSDHMLAIELDSEEINPVFERTGHALLAYRAISTRDLSFVLGKFIFPQYYQMEVAEMNAIAQLDVGEHVIFNAERLYGFLQREPYPIIQSSAGTQFEIGIINSGILSDHYGRHTAKAAVIYFDYLYDKWGNKPEGRKLRANFYELFDGLYWSPYALSTMAKTKQAYQEHQRYMMLVSRFKPERVTPGMWMLLSKTKEHPWSYLPSDFYVNDGSWHNQSPPPGSAIDLQNRAIIDSLYSTNTERKKELRESIYSMAPNSPWLPFIKIHVNRNSEEFEETPENFLRVLEPVSEWNYTALNHIRWRWKHKSEIEKAVVDQMVTFDESSIKFLVEDFRSNMKLNEYCDLAEQYFELMDDWVQASFILQDYVYACYHLGLPDRVTPWMERYEQTGSTSAIHAKALLYEFDGEYKKASEEYEKLFANFETGRYKYQEMLVRIGKEKATKAELGEIYGKVLLKIFPEGMKFCRIEDLIIKQSYNCLAVSEDAPHRFIEAGLKPGDKIIAANQIQVKNFYQFRMAFMSSLPEKPELIIVRDDEFLKVSLSPIFDIYGSDWYTIEEVEGIDV